MLHFVEYYEIDNNLHFQFEISTMIESNDMNYSEICKKRIIYILINKL